MEGGRQSGKELSEGEATSGINCDSHFQQQLLANSSFPVWDNTIELPRSTVCLLEKDREKCD